MTAMAHITHEAVEKVGGIGAVLQGLLTSRAYRKSVERSILVGPLFDPSAAQPLGPRGVLLYDRLAGVGDPAAARALEEVEREHGVRLVYGRRPLAPDVTAGDHVAFHLHANPVVSQARDATRPPDQVRRCRSRQGC